MQGRNTFGRDISLQVRMAFTMLLLTLVYLIFSFVLFRVTRVGLFFIVIPLAGLFIQYYFSDKLVLASAGAKVIEPSEAPGLYSTVERLAQQADLPIPKVAIVDTPMPNAFATGRNPKHAVIAVTSGLLSQLSDQEIAAVLGHEMTHIRNRDMVVMTMAGSFAAVAAYIVQMSFWIGLWGGGEDERDGGGNAFLIILLVSAVVAVISHILVATLSRYREFAADRGSAILTGAPEQLESALLRISGNMQKIPSQDLRQAQNLSALYIASPSQSILGLFADHPPVEARIARLQQLERRMVAH